MAVQFNKLTTPVYQIVEMFKPNANRNREKDNPSQDVTPRKATGSGNAENGSGNTDHGSGNAEHGSAEVLEDELAPCQVQHNELTKREDGGSGDDNGLTKYNDEGDISTAVNTGDISVTQLAQDKFTQTDLVQAPVIRSKDKTQKAPDRDEKILLLVWMISGVLLNISLVLFSLIGFIIGSDDKQNCREPRNSVRVACLMVSSTALIFLVCLTLFIIGIIRYDADVRKGNKGRDTPVYMFLIVMTCLVVIAFLANIGMNINGLSEAVITIHTEKCTHNVVSFLCTTVIIYLLITAVFVVASVLYWMLYVDLSPVDQIQQRLKQLPKTNSSTSYHELQSQNSHTGSITDEQ